MAFQRKPVLKEMHALPEKPLGHRAYGSIPHLPGSKKGPADRGLTEKNAAMLLKKTRDHHDFVIVQEKLDGSNVAVAKLNGKITPLIRAGYKAISSKWEQHKHFANWVFNNQDRFDALLKEQERICGEWLLEAHGTLYCLPHEPFVAFDLITGNVRTTTFELNQRCMRYDITTPRIIHSGSAISIEEILKKLEPSGHGALEQVEGAVWRLERKGMVELLAKFVRPEKENGKYLYGLNISKNNAPIYNTLSQPENINGMPSYLLKLLTENNH